MASTKLHLFLLVLGILGLINCENRADFDLVPQITYEGISNNQLNQSGEKLDSLQIFLSFTDGDGDIGSESNGQDVELIDSRNNSILEMPSLPMVPVLGSQDGASGDIILRSTFIPGLDICCILPNGRACEVFAGFPVDTMTILIRIKDRAGNWSNQVRSDPIFINCN